MVKAILAMANYPNGTSSVDPAGLSTTPVEYAVYDAVARITMNRPTVLNASNQAMKIGLREALARAEADESVGAIVLTGAGRAFCAGGDLKEGPPRSSAEYRARIHLQQRLCEDLWRASKPIIAAINGHALGGGLEMALLCDIRIAARSATLGTPAARIGSASTGGLHGQLTRVVGAGWATSLVLLGESIDAKTALRIGLVTAVYDSAQLLPEADRLATRLASYPLASMSAAKSAFRQSLWGTLTEHLAAEEDLAVSLFQAP